LRYAPTLPVISIQNGYGTIFEGASYIPCEVVMKAVTARTQLINDVSD